MFKKACGNYGIELNITFLVLLFCFYLVMVIKW